jgi:transcriptional regulator with XRE-family HTH domain
MNVVGPQVRQLREAQKMTQEDLTARCNIVGFNISRGTLAKIESQVRQVTDKEAALLAKALKVSVDALYKQKG